MIYAYPSIESVPDLGNLQEMIGDQEDIHEPPNTLLCAENTHNFHGGVIIRPEELQNIKKFAEKNDLKFHLDGARIFTIS